MSELTVLGVLQSTTAYFKKRAIESPRLNAEHLIAFSLGKKRLDLYLEFERPLSEPELAPLRELVRRRGQGEPLQHLLGTVEFANHVFVSDKRALIPRPETEQLVEYLSDLTWPEQPRMLDVGTGSGVIALSLAGRFPKAELEATDLSADALALARENAERLGLPDRIHFSQGHLLEKIKGAFDLIVANLPYVSAGEAGQLAPELRHEPAIALYGGAAGDELIRELMAAAPPHLRPGGMLALEIGHDQSTDLAAFLEEKNYHDIVAKNDYSGTPRFLFARYG
ncbi:MAG TPA: peptide chain release factor N(5)-glutamine methyltransferase [Chthoniobacterales bacterium]|nr:peptide chain release factor N(5)-glutamine methyltransferase [Chthoniobacterales bacterium]